MWRSWLSGKPLTVAGSWCEGSGGILLVPVWGVCAKKKPWQPGTRSLQGCSCDALRATGMAAPCSVSRPCFGWKGRQIPVCVRSLALVIHGASALGCCFTSSSQTGFLIKPKRLSAGAQRQPAGVIRAAQDTGRTWLPATHANLGKTPSKNASSGAGQTFHTLGLEEGKHRQGFFP